MSPPMSHPPPSLSPAEQAVQTLRDPAEIRRRCAAIAAHVSDGSSPHFTLDRSRLPAVAARIAKLSLARFPTLRIPYHSRWRHFEAGGVDRAARLDQALQGLGAPEAARARIDLTVVSVLLDAGAGPAWRYQEPETDAILTRSEGLAVASFDAFLSGQFSSDPDQPCRVDAPALLALQPWHLATIFQVHDGNPLVGLEGRTDLMHRLGASLAAHARQEGGPARPGRLYDLLLARLDPATRSLQAADILRSLLDTTSAIWPSGQWLGRRDGSGPEDQPLGDVWPHPAAGGQGLDAGRVPFHKLSQWLSYSLLEPFEWAGVPVTGLDALTGLPEYRNGGLLLDAGVLLPRDAATLGQAHTPADPWVIEWRALTVALLDELAPLVRAELGVTAEQLPLACMLEGGSWAAGRQIAAERRLGGPPPVRIDSDGTVF
ncbi:MAG: hypothetical protein RLZZ524_25 [Pseudomonadota bacterium]